MSIITQAVNEATSVYLATRAVAEAAKQAMEEAERILKETFNEVGINEFVTDGTKVVLVEAKRAKYDTATLSDIVDEATFNQVTKTEIDGTKFKAAIALGVITDEVADKVTTYTAYEQVRVYTDQV